MVESGQIRRKNKLGVEGLALIIDLHALYVGAGHLSVVDHLQDTAVGRRQLEIENLTFNTTAASWSVVTTITC